MSNYEASGANYSLWELESAGSRSAKDNLWDASAKAQHVGTDFLTFFFFWLVPPFFPLSALQGEAIREKSLRARVLSTLKPNCFSSPQQSCQDSLHHYSSTFYCAKCHRFPWQQPLTYFKKLFYIYMCAACGCHLVYKPEVKRGQDVLQVLQGALCALWKALYTEYIKLSLSFSHPELQHRILARLTLAWPWGRISGQPCPGTAPRRYPRFISCHPVASPSDR